MNIPLKVKDQLVERPADFYNVIRAVFMRENKIERKQEHFWVMGISLDARIEFIELVALGTLNAVAVQSIDVFSVAIRKRCKRIVLIHNHPGGDVTPSIEDINKTTHLIECARLLRVDIVDHLIISELKYFSFWNESLINNP